MSSRRNALMRQRKMIKELNPLITCGLCRGYLIDATTLIECLHVFCRACVLRHFENKLRCPTCNLVYKKKNYPYFRSDSIIQALVYKLVPGLYNKEVQRREDFYRSTGARASSSCSEDSVLGDLNEEQEEWQIPSPCGADYQFLSPDDAVSLSLEYYQQSLDTSNQKATNGEVPTTDLREKLVHTCDSKCNNCVNTNNNVCDAKTLASADQIKGEDSKNAAATDSEKMHDEQQHDKKKCDRRYLRCPAAVTMSLLQKFLRMKHALTAEHRVDIIHAGEVLPTYFTLIDVAYTFKWRRLKPLRFFYRIFTPIKIQPIKIITTSSGKHKQLQVVPAKSHQSIETKSESPKEPAFIDLDDQSYRNKETLMTNLQLQSITKPPQIFTSRLNVANDESVKRISPKNEQAQGVYDYQEPDKEEIRAFAEKRDLEWALQKQLDEAKERYRISKKRKKNKHKNNLLHKKRKLHAEITSSDSLHKEESLKLKVKLTQPNGYKHKHHRQNQDRIPDATPQRELSSKEKLLQMRQVRHKHIHKPEKTKHSNDQYHGVPKKSEETRPNLKFPEAPREFTPKTSSPKEKPPSVHLERSLETENQAKQSFLKTFQSYTENFPHKNGFPQSLPKGSEKASSNVAQSTKPLEKKIATLHQQCTTIEPKPVIPENQPKTAPDLTLPKEKPLILNSQFSTGFTVSKVETGIKRNSTEEHQKIQEKRPSLEITLIRPPGQQKFKAPTKRPLPATIPLDKIRCSINKILGINVVPRTLQMTDTIALDLSSKPNKITEISSKMMEPPPTKLLNGLSSVPNNKTPPLQLSNLQMLSKVATEHPSINNKRPQMPSLNTLKIPNPNNINLKSNLSKLPKLTEISKTQFRLPNPQVRNMRPNQNQSIRNIPNPSLLVRQQNQNRLNSLNTSITVSENKQTNADVPKEEKLVKVDETKQIADNTNPLPITTTT